MIFSIIKHEADFVIICSICGVCDLCWVKKIIRGCTSLLVNLREELVPNCSVTLFSSHGELILSLHFVLALEVVWLFL